MQNNIFIEFSTFTIILSIALRVGALYYFWRVFWRSLQQSQVRNGLIVMRYLLLTSSSVLLVITASGIILISIRWIISPMLFQTLSNYISILNSLGFFVVAFVKDRMQLLQYSPEQLDLHRKIEQLEKKKVVVKKKAKKKKA